MKMLDFQMETALRSSKSKQELFLLHAVHHWTGIMALRDPQAAHCTGRAVLLFTVWPMVSALQKGESLKSGNGEVAIDFGLNVSEGHLTLQVCFWGGRGKNNLCETSFCQLLEVWQVQDSSD